MDERIIFKLALIVSIFGILTLLFISNIEPEIITIAEAKNVSLDEKIKVRGKIVENKKLDENFYVLTLKDDAGNIQILLDKNFISNKTVEVIGEISKYKNKTQIRVEKMVLSDD